MKRFLKIFCFFVLAFALSISLVACNGSQGKSAYEVAVANGYVGSEEDWLNSLKGLNGTSGKDADISADDLYALGIEKGYYSDTKEGYLEFIKDYLSDSISTELISTLENLSNIANATNVIATVGARCLNSVVAIYVPVTTTNYQLGAGIIYYVGDDVAYVVTNYHLSYVESAQAEANEYHMFLYGYEYIVQDGNAMAFGEGDIVGSYIGGTCGGNANLGEPGYDLAVLKVEGESLEKLKSLGGRSVEIADSDKMQIGDTAIAIGNPLGTGIALTSGYVSKTSEYVTVSIAGLNRQMRCFRMDTPLNSGSSGGGVFDINGRLLGISNSKNISSQVESVSNAIPSNDVKAFVDNIIYFHEEALKDNTKEDKTVGLHKYIVGITYSNINPTRETNLDGTNKLYIDMKVASVVEGRTAQSMGVRVDDYIVGMYLKRSGEEVEKRYDFSRGEELQNLMLTLRPGDEIAFIVKRLDNDNELVEGRTDSHIVTIENYVVYKGA